MAMKQIKAHYDGKEIVLDENVQLLANAHVTVLVADDSLVGAPAKDEGHPDLFAIFGEPIDTGIEDFAENHDHYLYGTPKRTSNK